MGYVLILLILFVVIYALGYLIYKSYFYCPPIEQKQLRNKCVIITGVSRGIDEGIAYEYARYNCRLILAARSIDILKNQVAQKCLSLGATQVECIQFNASTEQACIELIKKTIEYSSMATLPYLTQNGTYEQPSQIIAVSSLAGSYPLPQTTIYGTTKHAIQNFFLNLTRELRISKPYQNRVTTSVAILGLIATEQALTATDKSLHFLPADVRKTAQAIIAAGIYGQTRLFYPYRFAVIPSLYYIFSPLFKFVTRLGD
ncbi:unnamed protein product [Rotaria sp. Silwood1]|nr:unnamed protein product [Rotaria sp. Silwood1]CAF4784695.1 unnamed protein product [Rotaria sp. Silwood1]